MTVILTLAIVILLTGLLGLALMRANPTTLANGLRLAGPAVLGLAGAAMLLTGRAGMGGMLLSGAVAWYASGRAARARRKSPGQRSTVRTAALEMELDHDTGALEGVVLAGRYEGRVLAELSPADLTALHAELGGDPESRQLLETYLDGRTPGWRDDVEPDGDRREGVAPSTGAMTKEEAYKVLGLEPGAGVSEIRKAHRRLMQRLHPDLGGSSFLAARINEAKDVLLSDH
jgi:hypothetical protein